MIERRRLAAATLLGLGGGMRSFAPPVALGLYDRGPLAGPARFIAIGAGVGEVIADQSPRMPSRWSRRGMSLRLAFSTGGGRELAGTPGAALAAAAAVGTAFAGSHLRSKIKSRAAQAAAGAAEDVLSYALVLAGAHLGSSAGAV